MSVVSSTSEPRWTLRSAPISSQRWYNCRGRMGRGRRRRLWSSSLSYFSHCTSCVPLCPRWLSSPPSLSHYPAPTTGQFVRPAWLPPPLLLRYLGPFLHFNGRYWLENFHDPFCYSSSAPLPVPATFNLITGFLQPLRGGPTQEDNGRASGFTNTLLTLTITIRLRSRVHAPPASGPSPPGRHWFKKKQKKQT